MTTALTTLSTRRFMDFLFRCSDETDMLTWWCTTTITVPMIVEALTAIGQHDAAEVERAARDYIDELENVTGE